MMELPVKAPSADGVKARYRIETKSLSYGLANSSGLLDWRHWCRVHADSRAILQNVSCEARHGEVLAIVGPSGAGKTTLLSVLAGMVHQSRFSGHVLVNGCRMDVSHFRRLSGYVTQEDALFPLLTVEETLMYSARLRLPASYQSSAARVKQLLKELGLEHVARSRVGSNGGGISGGEKRRVSIAVDLVHNPPILLLDEPTSGLDSASALHIVSLLKSMAKVQEKTVVLTIHQPGFRILELFDRVLLLAGGVVRHHGSLELLQRRMEAAGHSIPEHVNVLEYAMDAMTSLGIGNPMTFEELVPTDCATADHSLGTEYLHANSHFGEVVILGKRFFTNILRTNQLFAAKMIQSLVAGFGLGSIFMNVSDVQARVGFFAFTLTFLLSSTTEGLPVFLQERRILMRETSMGAYRVSSYVVANALVFLPFLLAVAVLYAVPVYWMVGLRGQMDGFFYFFLVVWLVVVMANSFVVCFSALVPNFIMGNSLIAGLIGSFFLFSGYFIAKDSIPRYWIFMHYVSLFKYPFEAFMVNEYGGERGRKTCLQRAPGEGCVLNGEMFLRQQGLKDSQRWSTLWMMLVFICSYRLLCFAILWYRCSKMAVKR